MLVLCTCLYVVVIPKVYQLNLNLNDLGICVYVGSTLIKKHYCQTPLAASVSLFVGDMENIHCYSSGRQIEDFGSYLLRDT